MQNIKINSKNINSNLFPKKGDCVRITSPKGYCVSGTITEIIGPKMFRFIDNNIIYTYKMNAKQNEPWAGWNFEVVIFN